PRPPTPVLVPSTTLFRSPRRTLSTCSFLKAVVNSRRPSAPLRNSPILLLLEEVQHNLSHVSTPIGGRRTSRYGSTGWEVGFPSVDRRSTRLNCGQVTSSY